MRLQGQAKMGYYPTPDSVTPIIANHLKAKTKGLIRTFDPCAGEGTALSYIGRHLNALTYGIEIDLERGGIAKDTLTKCLVTDYQNTRISLSSFSVIWLNPPYDWSIKDNDLEASERYERTFLRDCIRYLCKEGILVYIIPQKRLDVQISRLLAYRFEQLSVYRFPEEEYKAFKQLVILGVLKKKPEKDDATAEYLKSCGEMKAIVPYITSNPTHIYEVPLSPSKAGFMFRSKDIDPYELGGEIERHGVFSMFREMLLPVRMLEKVKPLMPLRLGHLSQMLSCGLLNGVVWDREKKNPLLVKGITKKIVNHSIETEGDMEKHIEKEQFVISIRAFDKKGQMFTIQ